MTHKLTFIRCNQFSHQKICKIRRRSKEYILQLLHKVLCRIMLTVLKTTYKFHHFINFIHSTYTTSQINTSRLQSMFQFQLEASCAVCLHSYIAVAMGNSGSEGLEVEQAVFLLYTDHVVQLVPTPPPGGLYCNQHTCIGASRRGLNRLAYTKWCTSPQGTSQQASSVPCSSCDRQ